MVLAAVGRINQRRCRLLWASTQRNDSESVLFRERCVYPATQPTCGKESVVLVRPHGKFKRQHFDKPGKISFTDMDPVAKYAE